jgi:hypothetical protein
MRQNKYLNNIVEPSSPDQPRPQQTSSMDWLSDQMNANWLLRDHQSLTQQNQTAHLVTRS